MLFVPYEHRDLDTFSRLLLARVWIQERCVRYTYKSKSVEANFVRRINTRRDSLIGVVLYKDQSFGGFLTTKIPPTMALICIHQAVFPVQIRGDIVRNFKVLSLVYGRQIAESERIIIVRSVEWSPHAEKTQVNIIIIQCAVLGFSTDFTIIYFLSKIDLACSPRRS
jgi:hypothetical protein